MSAVTNMLVGDNSRVKASLANLPVELHAHILSYLRTSDRKNLRLLNTHFVRRTPLLITRVFLSANIRNIEVFRAIADHEDLRSGVTEIIWDDARFPDRYGDWSIRYDVSGRASYVHPRCSKAFDEAPDWFQRGCRKSLGMLKNRKADCPSWDLEPQLSVPSSFAYFMALFEQQRSVLATGADADALAHGLRRFPSLRRVTITPAGHGLLNEPLYETPMIRGFPDGFVYPSPRPWPKRPRYFVNLIRNPPKKHGWEKWRGLSTILRGLADHENSVTELVIDTYGLPTGMNTAMFDDLVSHEYQGLYNLIRKPGFRRLDLVLRTGHDHEPYNHKPRCKVGNLWFTLSQAKGLEHVKLATDLAPNMNHHISLDLHSLETENEIRLQRDICPIRKWPKLQHLGLAGFYLRQEDLITLLAAAPPSLRSVELSNLRFIGGGSYRSVLCCMRDQLGWCEWPTRERPKVTIAVGNRSARKTMMNWVVFIEDEVSDFLYRGGSNPFGDDMDEAPNHIRGGVGVERDLCDPGFERPWKGCPPDADMQSSGPYGFDSE